MKNLRLSWQLYQASARLLVRRPQLFLYPLFAFLLDVIFFVAIFSLLLWLHHDWSWQRLLHIELYRTHWFIFLLAFVTYYICFQIIVALFSMSLMIYLWHGVGEGAVSLCRSMQESSVQILTTLRWALLNSTYFFLFESLERERNWLGRWSRNRWGLRWRLINLLILPVMVIERKKLLSAVRSAGDLITNHWGEHITRRIGFGSIYLMLLLPAIIVGLALVLFEAHHLWIWLAVVACYILLVAMIQIMVNTIFQVSLYSYLRLGKVPQGFKQQWLDNVYMV